ncbi:MAG: hypothetical protein ACYDH4_11150 [Candidatus Cryosericum sp.]
MPTVSETSLQPGMGLGVPTSFGSILPSFERLLGYVDASAAPVGARIVWKLYAISGGVRSLAAISDPIPSGPKPYVVFAVPNEGDGLGVPMISGTTYEMVGIAQDASLVNILAGFVGYDIEVNTQPNEVAAVTVPLMFGTEVVFGSLANHHARVQVQFDPLATQNTAATLRVYGTITGAGGSITAVIAEGTQPNKATDPTIPINLAGLGFVTAQLRIQSTNPQVLGTPVTGVIIGADVNLDISGGGGPPSGPAGGYLDGTYPNPSVRASPTLVFRPGAPDVSNLYSSWAGVMAAFVLTTGPVVIAIDDSSGVATVPAGMYDLQDRVTLVAQSPKESPQTTLNLPEGVTLKGLNGIDNLLQVVATPTATPTLAFNSGVKVFSMDNGAVLANRGTRALVTEQAGLNLNFVLTNSSLFDNSVAPNAPLTDMPVAGALFSITSLTNSGLLGTPTNTVTGVVGTQLILQYDASWQGDPTLPGFFGTLVFSRTVDAAEFVSYVDTPPLLGSNNVQGAIDALKNRPITNALAAGLIFRPGGVATQNVYVSWAALMVGFALANGLVTIEVDDSIAPANIPVGIFDMEGRAVFVPSNPGGESVLNIVDGGQLLNPVAVRGDLIVQGSPTVVASLAFTGPSRDFYLEDGAALLLVGGTRSMIDVSSPRLSFMVSLAALFPGTVGHEMFNMLPGSTVFVSFGNQSDLAPANTPAVGSGNVIWNRDRSSSAPIFGAGFTGIGAVVLSDGPDCRTTTIITGATTLVVDAAYAVGAGSAEETIYCKPLPAQVTQIDLPSATLPMNKGRHLKIVDDNGGSGVSPIRLLPFGAQHLNGVNAAQLLSSNWSSWDVFCDGAQWVVNVDTDTSTDQALAASIVYRPGGAAGGNVFTSWASVMAAFATTQGPVTIAIDDSIITPAPVPVGIYDMRGRATITSYSGGTGFPTLDINAGAQLISVDFTGPMQVNTHSTALVPAFVQDRTTQVVMVCREFVEFIHTGVGPWLAVAAAGFADVTFVEECLFDNSAAGAGAMISLGAGASGLLEAYESPQLIVGANSLIAGPVGTSMQLNFDASWPGSVPPSPGFAGTLIVILVDGTQGILYNPTNPLPAPASFSALAQPSAQTAIDAHVSPQRTIAANYTVDTTGFDQTLFANNAGINVTIPLAANWPGREITVKDISVGGVAPYYNLVPTGADNIEGANAPFPQNTSRGSFTIKSDGVGSWWVV